MCRWGRTSAANIGDDSREMASTWLIDDDTSEAITRGDDVDLGLASIAAVARRIEAEGDRPPPSPSPELQALFVARGHPRPGAVRPHRRGRVAGRAGDVAGRSLVARAAIGASVAATVVAAVSGAAAAGVLPEPVREVVEFVSPVNPPSPPAGDRHEDDGASTPATPGGRGAATPGGAAADDSGSGTVTPAPAPAATEGLDRAAETPASSHLPTTTSTTAPPGPPSTTPAPTDVPGYVPTTPTMPTTPTTPTTAVTPASDGTSRTS